MANNRIVPLIGRRGRLLKNSAIFCHGVMQPLSRFKLNQGSFLVIAQAYRDGPTSGAQNFFVNTWLTDARSTFITIKEASLLLFGCPALLIFWTVASRHWYFAFGECQQNTLRYVATTAVLSMSDVPHNPLID
jgi:hypothetical protein